VRRDTGIDTAAINVGARGLRVGGARRRDATPRDAAVAV